MELLNVAKALEHGVVLTTIKRRDCEFVPVSSFILPESPAPLMSSDAGLSLIQWLRLIR